MKLIQSLKQSPTIAAVIAFVVGAVVIKIADPSLEKRIDLYFVLLLCFATWCFEWLRAPSPITDEEAERLGKRWEQEVRHATQKLADVVKSSLDSQGYDNQLYGLRNKPHEQWTKEQQSRLHEIYRTSYVWRLQDLSLEFRKDEHEKQLRRWWEHAEKQDVDVPGLPKLLRMTEKSAGNKSLDHDVIEISDMELYAYQEALNALEHDYDEPNILSMHPRVQELLKLRNQLPRQELIQKLREELRRLQEKGSGKARPLTPQEKEANRMALLKEFAPQEYEEELRKKKG